MRKSICIFILILFAVSLFADIKNKEQSDLSLQEKFNLANKELVDAILKKRIVFTGFSLAISPRIYLGLVKVNKFDNRIREDIFYLHGFYYRKLQVYGIALKSNYFKEYRTGLFTSLIIGIDYSHFPLLSLNPGGSTGGTHWMDLAIPTIALGLGYSFQIGDDSYLRISLDAGFKIFLSNLNVTFVF